MHESLRPDLHVNIPTEFEIIWIKARPDRLPRYFSANIFAAVYFPDSNQEIQMIDHIHDTLDILLARYPNAGICIIGDMNQMDTPYQVCAKIANYLKLCTFLPERQCNVRQDHDIGLFLFVLSTSVTAPIMGKASVILFLTLFAKLRNWP